MTGRNPVAAGGKNQRVPIGGLVFLYSTQKNDVVAAVILFYFAANELGDRALHDRNPGLALGEVDSREFVGQGGGELARKVMLFRFQNVHREMSAGREIGKT